MKNSIYFDHTYTGDQNHKFWKKLKKHGFTLHPKTTNHPNSSCNFIMFEKWSYLEFIHNPVRFQKKYPGIAFGISKNSTMLEISKVLKKKKLSHKFIHRNYNWEENKKDYLPGWNFLTFKNLGIRTFYPWIIEYEPDPDTKTKWNQTVIHPNNVTHISGHEFEINAVGEKFFSKIFGQKIDNVVTLIGGTKFYFKRGKRNFHSKVILSSKNLKETKKFMPRNSEYEFYGQTGYLLENPSKNSRMWDILILEE